MSKGLITLAISLAATIVFLSALDIGFNLLVGIVPGAGDIASTISETINEIVQTTCSFALAFVGYLIGKTGIK